MSSVRGENPVEMYQRSLCINNGINSPDSQRGRRIEQIHSNGGGHSVSLIKRATSPNSSTEMGEAETGILVLPASNRPQNPGEIQLVK